MIGLSRQRVEPFTERQIELMRTFAAQAVIAMENARLLGELRERTTDLARSVDELTATGDVLKIISRSSVDLETVLNTLVETVARLCRADHTVMLRRRDDLYHLFASHGISAEARNFFLAHPFAPSRETITGRTALERRAIHIEDVLQDPEYTYRSPAFTGARSSLGIPLLRGDTLIGVFVATRTQVDPFTAKEIELATTFADQAVIAIENARLFDELRERQAELRVTAFPTQHGRPSVHRVQRSSTPHRLEPGTGCRRICRTRFLDGRPTCTGLHPISPIAARYSTTWKRAPQPHHRRHQPRDAI